MRSLSAIAFLASFGNLIATQIILRKLGLFLPVDLTAYAFLLCIQFLTMAGGYLVFLFVPQAGWFRKSLPLVMGSLGMVLIALSLSGQLLLPAAVAFFVFSAIQSVIIYRIVLHYSVEGKFARLNFLIYSGSALGLLAAEKIGFKFFPLSEVLWVLALLQIAMAIGYLFSAKTPDEVEAAPGYQIRPKSLIQTFVAGYILFSGLIIAYRLLRIYLRDTADVTAEVTAISMILGALVSFRFVQLIQGGVASKFYLLLAGPLVFVFVGQNLHSLTGVPREFLIAILLAGVSGWASFLFNDSFADSRSVRQVTLVLLCNTLGSFLGALSFGYFIIPTLKIEIAFSIYMVIFALATVAILLPEIPGIGDKRLRIIGAIAIGAFSFLIAIPFFSANWYESQISALAKRLVLDETVVASAETPQDLWVLTEKKFHDQLVHHRLIHNSHSMSGTFFPSRRYMKLMAYLGYLYTGNATTALNIGFGTGLTAQALLENRNLRKLDVSDVTREIEKLTKLIFAEEKTPDPLQDARLTYYTGGIRHFLRTHDDKYDIITGEPPPPSNSSIAYLYTADYYREILNHLTPGGVFTYWLPTHSVSDAAAEKIWRTFCSVFPNADLYAGTETNLIMVGYAVPGARKLMKAREALVINEQFRRETNLQSVQDIEALFIEAQTDLLKTGKRRLLTDDFSYIEEDYARLGRKPWKLPGLEARPQIYSADSAANNYTGLVALEKILPQKPSLGTVEWLMGIDYRTKAIVQSQNLPAHDLHVITVKFAEFLWRADYKGALIYLSSLESTVNGDERLFAYVVLLERLQNLDPQLIKRNAITFARGKRGVSPLFKNFVDRKLPPAIYGN